MYNAHMIKNIVNQKIHQPTLNSLLQVQVFHHCLNQTQGFDATHIELTSLQIKR